jgi:hypothetical protein
MFKDTFLWHCLVTYEIHCGLFLSSNPAVSVYFSSLSFSAVLYNPASNGSKLKKIRKDTINVAIASA